MEYRNIGSTKIKASLLGFGAMRLPADKSGGEEVIRQEESIELILKGFEKGINIIDTAYPYCNKQSEKIVGQAIKIWKKNNKNSKVYLCTKFPTWMAKARGDYRRYLEEQLKILDVDYIDFYHFHTLNDELFEEKILKYNFITEAQNAKKEGLIKHICFSFHDTPFVMKKIIDTGVFEAVLCQYNILDRTNEEAISYARQKGLGVFIMGPLAGGRVADLGLPEIESVALKFIFSNPDITTVFSGMQKIQDVIENSRIASQSFFFSKKEEETLQKVFKDKKIDDLIACNNCKYCLPCPNNVAIPKILKIYNYYKFTGIERNSAWQYKNIGLDNLQEKADMCTECGECEKRCPQGLNIIELLKQAHKLLSK
ncbi:MAG: aldo/keto reductase [Actinobacteria bacterium]|nr:aldo/keto reductase [Actinomycetota bacterium]